MARGRKLNIPLIKGVVMFVLGALVAVGSAFTGIGAQVAVAPMTAFLLGFTPEKTAGTSMVFTLFVAVAATAGAYLTGIPLTWWAILLLAFGAFMGAAMSLPYAARPSFRTSQRLAQGVAIALCVYVIGGAVHPRFGGIPPAHPFFQTLGGIFLVGLLSGAVSQLFQIASGILLVPTLVFLSGRPPAEAIITSLAVIAIASLLPSLSYTSRQLVDRHSGAWMIVGGLLGGVGGGWLLGRLVLYNPYLPLVAFALVAMFFSAYTLYKMS